MNTYQIYVEYYMLDGNTLEEAQELASNALLGEDNDS